MAVIYKGKHHRNPSGLMNKIDWLLVKSDWNIYNLSRIYYEFDLMNKSWYKAFNLARAILNLDIRITTDVNIWDKYTISIRLEQKYQKFVNKWLAIRKEKYGF